MASLARPALLARQTAIIFYSLLQWLDRLGVILREPALFAARFSPIDYFVTHRSLARYAAAISAI